MEVKGVV